MTVIRTLRANEIECRVGILNEKGLSLLLFKDARVDQKILDETFGSMGWKRSHQEIGGNLYCTVEVWDKEKNQWIAKQDVGTAGYAETEKGQASDSFKRACFNWGIGRELYEVPFIWIPADKVKIEHRGQGKDGRYFTNERFRVASIGYDENRSVNSLVIVNGKHQIVYSITSLNGTATNIGSTADQNRQSSLSMTEGTAISTLKDTVKDKSKTSESINTPGITTAQRAAMERELQRTGVVLDKVLDRYGISGLNEMTENMYEKAMQSLKKSHDAQVAA